MDVSNVKVSDEADVLSRTMTIKPNNTTTKERHLHQSYGKPVCVSGVACRHQRSVAR